MNNFLLEYNLHLDRQKKELEHLKTLFKKKEQTVNRLQQTLTSLLYNSIRDFNLVDLCMDYNSNSWCENCKFNFSPPDGCAVCNSVLPDVFYQTKTTWIHKPPSGERCDEREAHFYAVGKIELEDLAFFKAYKNEGKYVELHLNLVYQYCVDDEYYVEKEKRNKKVKLLLANDHFRGHGLRIVDLIL